MKYLGNRNFFMNLFKLKFLPFGVKAFVDIDLKIYINSLFHRFNEDINENNKKIIFKAALKIIIIHEIIYILKHLKENDCLNNISKTSRKREEREMLINYLFGKTVIKRINLDEAKKLNNFDFWNDINKLREIFKEDDLLEKEESNNKNIDYIDLYFTEEEGEDENFEEDEDIGIDID